MCPLKQLWQNDLVNNLESIHQMLSNKFTTHFLIDIEDGFVILKFDYN